MFKFNFNLNSNFYLTIARRAPYEELQTSVLWCVIHDLVIYFENMDKYNNASISNSQQLQQIRNKCIDYTFQNYPFIEKVR